MERAKRREDLWKYCAGVISATTANFSMGKDSRSKALEPYDFFDLPKPEPERMTDEQMLAFLKAFHNRGKTN